MNSNNQQNDNIETDFKLNYHNIGFDTLGQQYTSIDDMWKVELEGQKSEMTHKIGGKDNWYTYGAKYWENVPATVDGVLGGLGHLDKQDILDSKKFLEKMKEKNIIKSWNRALDCGAGIGRISQHLLCHFFDEVDQVEQNPAYIEQARINISETNLQNKIEYYVAGLQDFAYEKKYDVIWVQWVIGHLTDKDFCEFLNRSKASLSENGVLVIKENFSSGAFIIDKEDCTIIRDEQYFKTIYEQVGLNILYEEDFEGFPTDLYRVTTYVLR